MFVKAMILAAVLAPLSAFAAGTEAHPQEESGDVSAKMKGDVAEGNTEKIASVVRVIGALGSAAYVAEKVLGPISDAKKMAADSNAPSARVHSEAPTPPRPNRVHRFRVHRPDRVTSIGELRRLDNNRIERSSRNDP